MWRVGKLPAVGNSKLSVGTGLTPMAMSDSDGDLGLVDTFGGGVGEDHDDDEHDEDEDQKIRRDIKWRMADSFLKRGKSDKDILETDDHLVLEVRTIMPSPLFSSPLFSCAPQCIFCSTLRALARWNSA